MALVSLSLILPTLPTLPFVRHYPIYWCGSYTNILTAKFTGYQYGGRPLGITFVKYLNAGPGPEMMEEAEPTSGITQDQIM